MNVKRTVLWLQQTEHMLSLVPQIFRIGQPSNGGDRKTFEVMTSTIRNISSKIHVAMDFNSIKNCLKIHVTLGSSEAINRMAYPKWPTEKGQIRKQHNFAQKTHDWATRTHSKKQGCSQMPPEVRATEDIYDVYTLIKHVDFCNKETNNMSYKLMKKVWWSRMFVFHFIFGADFLRDKSHWIH